MSRVWNIDVEDVSAWLSTKAAGGEVDSGGGKGDNDDGDDSSDGGKGNDGFRRKKGSTRCCERKSVKTASRSGGQARLVDTPYLESVC